jgi:hypothetical protein
LLFIRPSKKRQLWGMVALLDLLLTALLLAWARTAFDASDVETRRLGAGAVALAGLSSAWAVALLIPGLGGWSPAHRTAAAVALAFLLGAATVLMPPWRMARPATAAFYAVPALHALLEGLAARLGLAPARPALLIAAAILLLAAARWRPDELGQPVVAGIFFSAAAAVHVALLRPSTGPSLAQRLFG